MVQIKNESPTKNTERFFHISIVPQTNKVSDLARLSNYAFVRLHSALNIVFSGLSEAAAYKLNCFQFRFAFDMTFCHFRSIRTSRLIYLFHNNVAQHYNVLECS